MSDKGKQEILTAAVLLGVILLVLNYFGLLGHPPIR